MSYTPKLALLHRKSYLLTNQDVVEIAYEMDEPSSVPQQPILGVADRISDVLSNTWVWAMIGVALVGWLMK